MSNIRNQRWQRDFARDTTAQRETGYSLIVPPATIAIPLLKQRGSLFRSRSALSGREPFGLAAVLFVGKFCVSRLANTKGESNGTNNQDTILNSTDALCDFPRCISGGESGWGASRLWRSQRRHQRHFQGAWREA